MTEDKRALASFRRQSTAEGNRISLRLFSATESRSENRAFTASFRRQSTTGDKRISGKFIFATAEGRDLG